MSEFDRASDNPGHEDADADSRSCESPDSLTTIRERLSALEVGTGMLLKMHEDIRNDIAGIRNEIDGIRRDGRSDSRSVTAWIAGTGISILIGIAGLGYMGRQIDTAWLHKSLDESASILEARQSDARADADRRWQELLETDRRRMQEIRDETGRRVDEFLRRLDERLAGKGSGGR